MSVGQPATPAQYFADLRLVCSLINGAWPHSQNLITGPGMAECLGRYIASTSGTATRRHTLCDTPPLDARPGAALITAAARILDGGDLRALGELLAPARDGASRKSPRGRWIRRYQRAGHDCSGGFRDALEPLMNSFQRTDRRSRGRRAPAPQITFAPEHIPEHLQDDWYHEHFRHIGGNTRLLRRAAALRLVQISAGGSLAEAAAFLGIDHRYLKASPGLSSVRRRPGRVPPRGARARPAAQHHPGPDQLQAPQGRPPALVHRPRGMAGHHQPASPDKRAVPARAQRLQAPVRIRGRLGAHHPGRAPPGTPHHRESACQQETPPGTGAATTCGTSTSPARQNRTTPPSGKSSTPTPTTSPQPSTASHDLPGYRFTAPAGKPGAPPRRSSRPGRRGAKAVKTPRPATARPGHQRNQSDNSQTPNPMPKCQTRCSVT